MASPCRVLLAPIPITPIIAFGYFLYRYLGIIDAETPVRYTRPSGVNRPSSVLEETAGGAIHNFSTGDLVARFYTIIAQQPDEETKQTLRHIFSFSGQKSIGDKKKKMSQWLLELSIALEDPKLVFEEANRLFTACLERKLDPWEVGFFSPQIITPDVSSVSTGDRRIVTLPVLAKQQPDQKGEIVSSQDYELLEERVRELRSAHIGLVIGGPAGSGKSTLTVSLAHEMDRILKSLATRRGWSDFSLTTELVNLDPATPTLEAIHEGVGKDRAGLETLKRPWTVDLAFQAQLRFQEAKTRSNLVFADLPGGKVDTITEITASLADVAILVTKDWSKMAEWRTFVHRMGITLVAEARSRPSSEGFPSVVSKYSPGRLIAGSVVDLDRVNRSWDRFVSWLAEFLLFDILPAFHEERRARLRGLLAEINRWQPSK